MREIKFRVWNNAKKSWVHGPHERPDLDGVNLFGENVLLGGFMKGVSIKELNDCVPLQYTGLKDKNGKEIYEGDILAEPNKPDKDLIIIVKYDVDNGSYITDPVIREAEELSLCKHNIKNRKWKIIGNIFENPEFLK